MINLRTMFHDLCRWVRALFSHYYGWIGGTFLAVVFFFVQVAGWQPPRPYLLAVVILGLLWSSFLAWSDEYREKLKLSNRGYDNDIRDRVTRILSDLPEEYKEVIRVILTFGPISTHDVAFHIHKPLEAANSFIGIVRDTGIIDNTDGKHKVKPQLVGALQDHLYQGR